MKSVNFFPHEVADLAIALDYIELSDGPARLPYNWRVRYIILLWISLVCMIPFDLAKFDTGIIRTGKRIENLALEYLPTAGLEREAATTLLSKLFIRFTSETYRCVTLKLTRSLSEQTLPLSCQIFSTKLRPG